MRIIKHFITITRHRIKVCGYCFRAGLIWQGLTHDLSKYSPSEFIAGARFYQGNMSPQVKERVVLGYSAAWLHHKGRNKHHFEYWTDINPATRQYEPVEMPRKYLAEMVMDRIAACKTYQGAAYTDASPLAYLDRARESSCVNPATFRQLHFLLTMLAEKGEDETFRFIREVVLTGREFALT